MNKFDVIVVADSTNGGLGKLASRDATIASRNGFRTLLVAPAIGEMTPLPGVTFAASSGIDRGGLRRVVRKSAAARCLLVLHGERSARGLALVRPSRSVQISHGVGCLPGTSWRKRVLREAWHRFSPLLFASSFTVTEAGHVGWQTVWYQKPIDNSESRAARTHSVTPGTYLLWFSRITKQKKFEMFCDVANQVAQQTAGRLTSLAAGTADPDEKQLLSSFSGNYIGFDSGPISQYSPGAVLCLFSHFEGRPLVIEEAIDAGIPVIASDLPGIRMMLGDLGLGSGIVDSPQQAVALATALESEGARASLLATQVEHLRRARATHRDIGHFVPELSEDSSDAYR